MLVSYSWLKDFIDLDQDPKDLAEKITQIGRASCRERV